MTNDERNKIALFRYGVIAPIISNPDFRKSKNEFFREASGKTYVDGNGKDIHVSPPHHTEMVLLLSKKRI